MQTSASLNPKSIPKNSTSTFVFLRFPPQLHLYGIFSSVMVSPQFHGNWIYFSYFSFFKYLLIVYYTEESVEVFYQSSTLLLYLISFKDGILHLIKGYSSKPHSFDSMFASLVIPIDLEFHTVLMLFRFLLTFSFLLLSPRRPFVLCVCARSRRWGRRGHLRRGVGRCAAGVRGSADGMGAGGVGRLAA